MRWQVALVSIVVGNAGCNLLGAVIPRYVTPTDAGPSTAEQIPFQDLATTYARVPLGDGGVPIGFAHIQAQLDGLGCTTANCHGGTQVPVLSAKPTMNAKLLLNYYDLISGCANGTPDPSDCLTLQVPAQSILLTKTCVTDSTVMHAGGKPFANEQAPVYREWLGWIAAGAPF
jgi:hypothetical protein